MRTNTLIVGTILLTMASVIVGVPSTKAQAAENYYPYNHQHTAC